MAWPFPSLSSSRNRRGDRVVAIELGTRSTKAVHIERRGQIFALASFVVAEAPRYEKGFSKELLVEHFRALAPALGARGGAAVVVLGPDHSRLTLQDFPGLSGAGIIRQRAKAAPKTYFQEELRDYLFDCHFLPALASPTHAAPSDSLRAPAESKADSVPADGAAPAVAAGTVGQGAKRMRGLLGGARSAAVEAVVEALQEVGWEADFVTLAHIGPYNAFRLMPAIVQKEAVALVEIGFHNTTISIVFDRQLVLLRVVPIGGDKLTQGLEEALSIKYSVAEGIKMVMPEKVQAKLQSLLAPLAEELRASAVFFEREFERSISQVYVSGASARSDFLVHLLETEAIIPCKSWNPTNFLSIEVSTQQKDDLAKDAPLLTSVVGGAMAWFNEELPQINLLAEQQEREEARRRDPVRRGRWAAAALVGLMLVWMAVIQVKIFQAGSQIRALEQQRAALRTQSEASLAVYRDATEIRRLLSGLQQLSVTRFLCAPVLDALQFSAIDGIQFVRVQIDSTVTTTPAKPATTNAATGRITPGRPADWTQRTGMTVTAKDYGTPPAVDDFIQRLLEQPFFQQHLRAVEPIQLRDRQSRQVDSTNPDQSFILFTIDAKYADRVFRAE
jgi:Tfp pilus assembly PilM family ATPase